jgi:PhnB protein
MSVTPHLVVPEAAAAATWYERAFDAREQSRVPLPGGKVMTVVLQIGESSVHIASEFPQAAILSPMSIGGTATVLQINTDDADTLWEQAMSAGATVEHALADQFWGERHGQLTDPFGHRWNIAQRIRAVPDDEIAAAAARIFTTQA